MVEKRVEADDSIAISQLGHLYYSGRMGLPQDYEKANELWLRAGELGDDGAYHNVANSYYGGIGVQGDRGKYKYYSELAAMGGHVSSRHNLGVLELQAGSADRALKHFMIAAGAGSDSSLSAIREGFLLGHVAKYDFEKALRAHKEAADELKSNQRDAAAAASRQRLSEE